jgi:alkylhydroperoxidase family enzyme
MSDIAEPPCNRRSNRDRRTDKQAFAQVEKWMATIREIDQERQTEHERAANSIRQAPHSWLSRV